MYCCFLQFRHVPGNLYRSKVGADVDAATNELVSDQVIVEHSHPRPTFSLVQLSNSGIGGIVTIYPGALSCW